MATGLPWATADQGEGKRRQVISRFTLDYWRDGAWYVGRLREVPGVFSQGETVAELEENLRDAYRLMREYRLRMGGREWPAIRVIAAWSGLSIETIRAALRRAGVRMRPPGRPRKLPGPADLIRLYVHWRWPTTLIAREYGVCDPSVVRTALLRLGIVLRRHTVPLLCTVGACRQPVQKVRHTGNGSLYGRRCREHRRIHYNMLNRNLKRRLKGIPPERWRGVRLGRAATADSDSSASPCRVIDPTL